MKRNKLPTKKQLILYRKLRRHGSSIALADSLIQRPGLARKVLSIPNRKRR